MLFEMTFQTQGLLKEISTSSAGTKLRIKWFLIEQQYSASICIVLYNLDHKTTWH